MAARRAWPMIRGVIADLDGVVYRGDRPIADAVEAVRRWRAAGVSIAFVTNNSTGSPEEFAAKFGRMGVAVSPDRVVTSGRATAAFVRRRWGEGTPVHVVGSPALAAELAAAGLAPTDAGGDVVVVGLDTDFTYAKLRAAAEAVRAGAALVATNRDRMMPTPEGFDPGAGSLLSAVVTAAGSDSAAIVVGKPEPAMIAMALDLIGTPAAATIVVGDQVATDIRAGRAAGLATVLVTTGVPVEGDPAVAPDFAVASLLDIPIPAEPPQGAAAARAADGR